MKDTIFVSGLYSGPSPSAGLGVARSLRQAFPDVRLVGVDYWSGSSGLHDPVFDDTWLVPSWDLLDPDLHAAEIAARLDAGHTYVSTLDVELLWLASRFPGHPGILGPSPSALAATSKSDFTLAKLLPFAVPPSVPMSAPDDVLYAFCRRHSFRVWLRGPYHDAVPITTWRDVAPVRRSLEAKWKTDDLSLSAHVRGLEESICIAAHRGRIADAVHMTKRVTTPDGKTWAGRVANVPKDLLDPIEKAVRALEWTGGAEFEFLRGVDGRLWLMEVNPRFPAWIHGATLTGRNLPAALLGLAKGVPFEAKVTAPSHEFTRVVSEIAVRGDLPLPLPAEPRHARGASNGKYGAALPAIVAMLEGAKKRGTATGPAVVDDLRASGVRSPTRTNESTPSLPPTLATDLRATDALGLATPARVLLGGALDEAFRTAKELGRVSHAGCRLRLGYSVKTCSDAPYLRAAREAGMFAECISQLEVKRALESGFAPEDVVLNGPGKWWPTELAFDGLAAVFADSLAELGRLVASGRRDHLLGVRIRLPEFDSRFGIPVESATDFGRLVDVVRTIPKDKTFGVHVHMASTLVGTGHWLDAVESAIGWATALERAADRPVRVLDLGGGYHPEDFPRLPFQEVVGLAKKSLHALETVVLEPGRALCQSTMALVTRVLDVRRTGTTVDEVVVDASIAELPLASVYPHRLAVLHADGTLAPVGRGKTRVLGRICMEDDVLAHAADLPGTLELGDRLVFCDAGAYERSMTYEFGRGGYPLTH
ncbi:MAG: hypothetical protein U0169_02840 [Polyangiaceae bacterium]